MGQNLDETKQKDKIKKERRTFLKKAVYAAPTFMVLGTLTKPTNAEAFTRPPSAPEWP